MLGVYVVVQYQLPSETQMYRWACVCCFTKM